jgi:CBS domain-containing protein
VTIPFGKHFILVALKHES